MPNLSWSFNIQVSGGPVLTVKRLPQQVEAYDRIEVVLEPETNTDVIIEIQPGSLPQVTLLVIQSSFYDGQALQFVASDGVGNSIPVFLDEPQVFAGGGIGLFGLAPKMLKFKNTHKENSAKIEIFVARAAIVIPSP